MDVAFLDANVLFSAAYRADSGLRRLWELPNVELVTSYYASGEAQINLEELDPDDREGRVRRLVELCQSVRTVYQLTLLALPEGIDLPDKDVPILLGAMESQATHLLTGDKQHFGRYFGQTIAGILILTPAAFLKLHPLPGAGP